MSEFREALRRAVDSPAVESTPKPRAGEHAPDKITMSIDWCAMFNKEHELTARLANDLEEAQANNDANARDATNARAERDLLRERERELVATIEAALDYCSSEAIGTMQQEIEDNARMCETLRTALGKAER